MQYLNFKQTIWSLVGQSLWERLSSPKMSFFILISMTLPPRAGFGSMSLAPSALLHAALSTCCSSHVSSFPPLSRWYARWWQLSCTSSSSPLSAGCWPRLGSPTWPWRAGYGTASSASASCVSDGVRILALWSSFPGMWIRDGPSYKTDALQKAWPRVLATLSRVSRRAEMVINSMSKS